MNAESQREREGGKLFFLLFLFLLTQMKETFIAKGAGGKAVGGEADNSLEDPTSATTCK